MAEKKSNKVVLYDMPIYYARLHPDRPNTHWDRPAWEVSIKIDKADKALIKELKADGIKLTPKYNKDNEDQEVVDYYGKTFRKYVESSNGDTLSPPRVLTPRNKPMELDLVGKIGNGSIANISLSKLPSMKNKGEFTFFLNAVQIMKLKIYENNYEEDFEEIDEDLEIIEDEENVEFDD